MMCCKKFIASRLIFLVGTFFWACSSESVSGGNEALDGMINGVSQKGPFLEGSSVTMQELDENSLAQTGKSFKGKVVNDRGDFSIENVALDHPYVLLEVNGYYRNEVTGKKSNGSIFMKALADVSKQPKVNINLLTHLEYERVQTLMEQNNMSIEEAKRQADREIFAAFYADVDYDKVEYLNIFGNGEGDAALLAINVLLLGEESDASFMERFALMGQDFAADGVWNDSLLKMKIADFACKANRSGKLAEIRKNIESWKIADVPAFETYVNRFWTNQYGLGKCDASNLGMRKLFIDDSRSSVFRDSAFKCTENGWAPYSNNEVYSKLVEECTAENEGEVKVVWVGNPKYGYDTYNRCESGLWVRGNISLTCDTTGVQVGDLCRKTGTINIFQAGMGAKPGVGFYVYAGNGTWEEYDPRTEITKECTESYEGNFAWLIFDVIPGRKDTIWYEDRPNNIFDETPSRTDTVSYECHNGEWTNRKITGYNLSNITPSCLSENLVEGDTCSFNDEYEQRDYRYKDGKWVERNGFKDNCATEGAVEGDTCSFEWHGEREAYIYIDGKWCPSKADPKLGYCPVLSSFLFDLPRLYSELDGNYYYCQEGDWILLNLVPRQYTDSRKEGLTDEEFDVLDLPKDAKVGDRVGGLLEDCWSDVEFYVSDPNGEGRDEIYDYCMPRHYYLYRENGSWTLETPEELAAYKRIPYYDDRICSPELLGTRVLSYGKRFDDPDEIYECVYDTLKIYPYPESNYESLKYRYWRVGLVFERSVKKN